MSADALAPLRRARDRMAGRIGEVLDRKMRRGTLERDDTADDLEIEAVGRCLLLTADAHDEIAASLGLPTLRERDRARRAAFPPHDSDEIPF